MIRLAAPIELENLSNGKGIRMIIWNQGCKIRCPGCHNSKTWSEEGGFIESIAKIQKVIFDNKDKHTGITLSGGDPFLQPLENLQIAKYAHELGLNVWAYCGAKFEELLQHEETYKLLEECDVLVDGPFILFERDITLPFRGSKNQRIIDVQQSLEKEEVILLDL